MALKQKRVDEEAIASGLEAIDEDEYHELLKKILDRPEKKDQGKEQARSEGKASQVCTGKGL
ncbi:MAG TPA: hypothetical protein DIS74_10850 [Bacteroidales bacterium]|nr:hypothetical protein [Bacteroidales bacterium]